jgi:RimJ/RimL family protein N-acetyltransferase
MSTPHPIRLRCAGHEDARRVFDWRNDPLTRAASHETLSVTWPVHELWWKASLGRADRVLLIGEDAWERPVGMVRFDAQTARSGEGRWLVGVQVAPERRGQGWGRVLLMGGIERMNLRRGAHRFYAEIKDDNEASRRLFAGCGFKPGAGLTWVLERRRIEAAA